jgi:LmbE family N-acetylglucosaminyl deacetylase
MLTIKNRETAMVIMAHPDDAEINCFGTICRLLEQGAQVILLIATNGEGGISVSEEQRLGSDFVKEEFSDQRLTETARAFEGMELTFGRDLVSLIEAEINRWNPDLVITHASDPTGYDHQDHDVLSKVVTNICRRKTRVRTLLHSQPHVIGTSFQPNCFIEVTEHWERKMAALECHETQQGRYYLSRAYHESRSLINGVLNGSGNDLNGRRFEAFSCVRAVI